MTLYSGQITQLLQGVSQQHPKDRAEGQITEQVNCLSDVVQGLRRRPPVKVLSTLTGISTSFTLDEHSAIYSYSRGDGLEEYIMLFDTAGNIKVYDAVDGAAKTVDNTVATAKAYLVCTDPKTQLRFHTIGDTTFILNTTKTMAMEALSLTAAQSGQCMLFPKQVGYGRSYEVYINGVLAAQVSTPSTVTISATTTNKVTALSTDSLMYGLRTGVVPAGWTSSQNLTAALPTGWTFNQSGDLIHIVQNTGADFTITVEDSNNNNDLKAIKNSVEAFERLPKAAYPGYKVEVTGLGDEKVDNYWVQWVTENTTSSRWNGPGYWQECAGTEILTQIDPETMPVKVTRKADGTFENRENSWVHRAAGDDDTNPVPSFIDTTGTDIGSYQNRLFILNGENICMTQAFDQLAWFAASTAAPSDDDPVDSASSDNQVTDLLHSTVYSGSLVLFSNNSQFIHPKDTPVTPLSFAVAADTKFNVSPNIRPVTTGASIVFPTEFGDYTNVWEYNINTLTGKPECESSTKHITRYILGNPVQMVANTTTDYVFLRTDDSDTTIYVNQFYVKDKKRAQLAWHKWEFDECDVVYSMTLIGQKLYLVTERDSTVRLELIDLSLPLSENSPFHIYLDHYYSTQVTSGSYTISSVDYTARVALAETNIDYFVQADDGTNEGFKITDYAIDSGYVYFNMPASSYVIQGYPYDSYGTLTNPYVRDAQGRPWTKRTIIEEVTINVQDTGFVTFEIGHAAGADYTFDFTGLLLNHWQYKIGVASELDSDVYLPVRDYRELVEIRYTSDHHLGFSLMSMEWLVRMTTRGRRSQ